jgi:sugar lactone lactonase YvrE
MLGLYTELKFVETKPLPSLLLEDFGYYRRSLLTAIGGGDPYAIRTIGTGFLYPPTALLVIELFAHISSFLAQASIYSVINILILLLMVAGVARRYGYSINTIWWWFLLALGFAPFLATVHLGQINMITQFGIFLMFFGETSAPVLAGMGLSLGIITKVTPLVFLGYLFINKRFKVIVAAIASTLALCLLAGFRYGFRHFITYLDVFQGMLHQFPGGTNSASLVAKLTYFFPSIVPNLQTTLETAQRNLTLYILVVILLSGVLAFLLGQREPFFIITNLGMMLAPNVLWYHHYVLLLLPLLVWLAWSRLRPSVVLWCMAGLTLTQIDNEWSLTHGFLTQVIGHTSILFLLAWQMNQLRLHFAELSEKGAVVISQLRRTSSLILQRLPHVVPAPKQESPAVTRIEEVKPRTQPASEWKWSWIRVAEVVIVLYVLLVLVLELQMIVRERAIVRLDVERVWQIGVKGPSVGQFDGALGLAVDASGNAYVAEVGNRRVQKITADGKVIAQWITGASGGERFNQPSGLAMSLDGNYIWLVDAGSGWVYRFTTDGAPVTAINVARYGLYSPRGIAVDANSIYLADTGNGRIVKLDMAGNLRGQWGKRGSGAGEFIEPFGLVVEGNALYVADSGNQRVQKLALDGRPVAQWRVPSAVSYLVSDGKGRLYVSDPDNSQIWVLTTSGDIVGCIGGQESAVPICTRPHGLAVDKENRLWVVGESQLAQYRMLKK